MIFQSWIALSMQAGWYNPVCSPYWFVLGYTFNCQSLHCVGIQEICLYLCPWTNPLRYGSWVVTCCRLSLLQSVWSSPFWTTPFLVPMAMYNFTDWFVFILIDMLNAYNSPTHLLTSFHISFLALHWFQSLSQLQQSPAPLQFLLPNVIIATDTMPNHWVLLIPGYIFSLVVSG